MDKPIPKLPAPHHAAVYLSVGIAAVIIGLAAIVSIFLYGDRLIGMNNGNTNSAANTNSTVNTNSADINSNANGNLNSNTNGAASNYPSGDVSWHEPREIDNLGLLGDNGYGYNYDDGYEETGHGSKYYETGTISAGPYTDGAAILISYYEEGPVFYPTFYYVAKNTAGEYFLLLKNSDIDAASDYGQETLTRLRNNGLTVDQTTDLTDLDWPAEMTIGNSRQLIKLAAGVNGFLDTDGLEVAFQHPVYGTAYTTVASSDEGADLMLGQTSITNRNGFYFRALDGTVRVYYLVTDIIPAPEADTSWYSIPQTVDIAWADGSKNTDQYDFAGVAGCGAINYINVISSQDLNRDTDLTRVGTTANGDAIYQETDRDSQRLHDYYDNAYAVYDGDKTSWSSFVNDHPLVYWVDPFNRLVELTNTNYRTMAECAKPVIYLYPTQPTNVTVTLRPQGGFLKTEPAYNRGWNVLAYPNGQLINQADGRTYPYLFWEGLGGIYQTPSQGFVIKRSEVHSFLVDSLGKLGLNNQETADFIEYWKPLMQDSPYYFVTFMGNQVADQIAPLTVTPKPDTVIRVLMDFLPLEQPIKVQGYALHAPERKGFTVIEWGGVKH